MNAQRRKVINDVINELAALRSRIETCQDEEQSAFDNMPEGLQGSDRGQAAEQAADRLQDALTACDDLDSALNDAIA